MKKTHIGATIIIVVLLGAGVWSYKIFSTYTPNEYVNEQTTVNAATGETSTEIKKYSATDISLHNDATSCYSSIDGSVYDLTAWVNLHPGGKSKILSICGVDGTESFMNQHHGGKKFMTILARFKIGTLI